MMLGFYFYGGCVMFVKQPVARVNPSNHRGARMELCTLITSCSLSGTASVKDFKLYSPVKNHS